MNGNGTLVGGIEYLEPAGRAAARFTYVFWGVWGRRLAEGIDDGAKKRCEPALSASSPVDLKRERERETGEKTQYASCRERTHGTEDVTSGPCKSAMTPYAISFASGLGNMPVWRTGQASRPVANLVRQIL